MLVLNVKTLQVTLKSHKSVALGQALWTYMPGRTGPVSRAADLVLFLSQCSLRVVGPKVGKLPPHHPAAAGPGLPEFRSFKAIWKHFHVKFIHVKNRLQ